jgi:hypothetical protein
VKAALGFSLKTSAAKVIAMIVHENRGATRELVFAPNAARIFQEKWRASASVLRIAGRPGT